MLRPTKHSHPDRTTLNAALLILSRLKAMRLETYSDLLSYIKKTIVGGDFLFLPALNLLFLLGLIEYRVKIDSFEYVGPNDAI
jgi:hypothetical protein